jgi:hypothetical protein
LRALIEAGANKIGKTTDKNLRKFKALADNAMDEIRR